VTLGAEHSATLATINDFSVLGPEHPCTVDSLGELVRLYESWNHPDEAQRWRAKLPAMQAVEQ